MRRIWCVGLTACLVLAAAGVGRADDQAEARKLVDLAITAQGGLAALTKYKATTILDKGTFHGMGAAIPYTGEFVFQGPGQQKVTVEAEVMGQKFKFIEVINKDKGWQSLMGMTTEMDAEKLAEEKEQVYAGWVTALAPLKGPGFTLALAGEIQVADRPALGVRVSHAGHRDVTLYFDKATHLLVKDEYQVKDDESGREQQQETLYAEYKEVEGMKQPMKVTIKRDGKPYVESEIQEYRFHESLDDSTFAMP
jgi:hypothetical protein